MSIRRPAFAGSFYPRDPEELKNEIENCFMNKFGPGKIPSKIVLEETETNRQILSIVVPHAGYDYSGPVASNAYYRLAQQRKPDLVVVLGPNHRGFGSPIALMGEGEWSTPLGKVKIDEELSRELVRISGLIDLDEEAHRGEHSIEVQIPFLQYIYGSSFKLIPICMGFQDLDTSRELGRSIASLMKDNNAVLVASSDMSHYVPQKTAEKLDRMVIDAVLQLDEGKLQSNVLSYRMSVCGYGPISTVLVASKLLGAKRAELLSYQTSGDTTGDYSAVVGYCSMAVMR